MFAAFGAKWAQEDVCLGPRPQLLVPSYFNITELKSLLARKYLNVGMGVYLFYLCELSVKQGVGHEVLGRCILLFIVLLNCFLDFDFLKVI